MTDNKSGEILIIEDDKDINDLLATALSKAGYRTRQAWSGTEGELLLKLDREAYALVLLDLMLPGLSGEELLALIRQMDASLPESLRQRMSWMRKSICSWQALMITSQSRLR